jgi:hypothetical protein
MRSVFKKALSFWPIFLLLLLEAFLFKANYISNTRLIGWDSTQPELNLRAHFLRDLSAAWQEYRGLGLLDGMAHAANLIHLGYIWFLSLLLPSHLIRYVFVFLMHFLGGLGVYFLVKRLLKGRSIPALIGALFYLLNPATIQMFYAPLELFVIHFGFLPWLFLVLIQFLDSGRKRDLFLLFIVNLLAVSQAHVPTIFIVYVLAVIIICLFYFTKKMGRVIFVFAVLFAVNAFWGFPYIYSAIKNTPVIVNSKINRLSNPEVILMNKVFSDSKSVILLRGFSLDYRDWNNKGDYVYQLEVWRDHLFKKRAEVVGYVFFGLSVLGMILILARRQKAAYSFILLFLFSFLNLSESREILTRLIPYYKEVFRFAFTKFSILHVLSIAALVGFSFPRRLEKLLAPVLIGGIIFLAFPAFRGNFFYDRLKLQVPKEYFEVFEFFDKQKQSGRVALLPQPSFWGWEYLTWGYRGSGFIWQGVNKPLLHRSFDPWSSLNETYYQELSLAISSGDAEVLGQIFEKYQVKWVLLDRSIYQPGGWKKDYFTNKAETLLDKLVDVKKVANFGFLTVYETNFANTNKFIWAPASYARIDTDLTYSQFDPIYQKYGDYIQPSTINHQSLTINQQPSFIGFPFVNFDKRGPVEIGIQEEKLVFENKSENAKVILPIEERIVADLENTQVRNCDLKKLGQVEKQVKTNKIIYKAFNNGVACDFVSFSDLRHDRAYVLRIKGENKLGRALKIYLQNWKTNRMDLEELLPPGKFDEYYFVLPKKNKESGYTLNLETRSFGRIASENVIEAIEIYPIDIDFLTSLYSGDKPELVKNNLQVLEVKKYGTWLYKVKTEGEGLLVLGQGYEKGWTAFRISDFGFRILKKHVKVNSWANGWITDTSNLQPLASSIYIIFWPQLLEYLGFGVFLVTGLVLVRLKSKIF